MLHEVFVAMPPSVAPVSSAPPCDRAPSSRALLNVVRGHEENVRRGPGPVKGTLMSATSVQRGKEFSACREVLGWSQEDAAARYGRHVRTIRRWERGESAIPSMEMDDIRLLSSRRTGT